MKKDQLSLFDINLQFQKTLYFMAGNVFPAYFAFLINKEVITLQYLIFLLRMNNYKQILLHMAEDLMNNVSQ